MRYQLNACVHSTCIAGNDEGLMPDALGCHEWPEFQITFYVNSGTIHDLYKNYMS